MLPQGRGKGAAWTLSFCPFWFHFGFIRLGFIRFVSFSEILLEQMVTLYGTTNVH